MAKKKYLDSACAQRIVDNTKSLVNDRTAIIKLSNDANLDNIKTTNSMYYAGYGNTVAGQPENVAKYKLGFNLQCYTYGTNGWIQYLNTGYACYRRYFDVEWSKWQKMATEESSVASADMLMTKLLTNENLDTIKDENLTVYYASATNTCANRPPNSNNLFSLHSYKFAGNGYVQVLTDGLGVTYKRIFSTKWKPWKRVITEEAWSVPVTVGQWCRVAKVKDYGTHLVTLALSQSGQASMHTLLVTTSHDSASLVQLGGSGYGYNSATGVRLVRGESATVFFLEIKDDYGYNGTTEVKHKLKWTPLYCGTSFELTPYTELTPAEEGGVVKAGILTDKEGDIKSGRWLFVSMWKALGGGYDQLTDTYSLNGVTALSFTEAMEIYQSRLEFPNVNGVPMTVRTNMVGRSCRAQSMISNQGGANLSYLFHNHPRLEVADLTIYNFDSTSQWYTGSGACLKAKDLRGAFAGCQSLRKIVGAISVDGLTADRMTDAFMGCTELEQVLLFRLGANVSLADCAKLKPDTMSYMIDCSLTSPSFVITVHPVVYAKMNFDNVIEAGITGTGNSFDIIKPGVHEITLGPDAELPEVGDLVFMKWMSASIQFRAIAEVNKINVAAAKSININTLEGKWYNTAAEAEADWDNEVKAWTEVKAKLAQHTNITIASGGMIINKKE